MLLLLSILFFVSVVGRSLKEVEVSVLLRAPAASHIRHLFGHAALCVQWASGNAVVQFGHLSKELDALGDGEPGGVWRSMVERIGGSRRHALRQLAGHARWLWSGVSSRVNARTLDAYRVGESGTIEEHVLDLSVDEAMEVARLLVRELGMRRHREDSDARILRRLAYAAKIGRFGPPRSYDITHDNCLTQMWGVLREAGLELDAPVPPSAPWWFPAPNPKFGSFIRLAPVWSLVFICPAGGDVHYRPQAQWNEWASCVPTARRLLRLANRTDTGLPLVVGTVLHPIARCNRLYRTVAAPDGSHPGHWASDPGPCGRVFRAEQAMRGVAVDEMASVAAIIHDFVIPLTPIYALAGLCAWYCRRTPQFDPRRWLLMWFGLLGVMHTVLQLGQHQFAACQYNLIWAHPGHLLFVVFAAPYLTPAAFHKYCQL